MIMQEGNLMYAEWIGGNVTLFFSVNFIKCVDNTKG